MSGLLETDWFIWGVGLILGFQVLVVMLGELLYRADRHQRPIAPILRTARNVVLPLVVVRIFVVRVLEIPTDAIPVRIISTALWISLLYAGLLLVNVLVFDQAQEGTWRRSAPSLFKDLVRMLLVTVGAAIVLAAVWEQDLGGLIAALGVGSIVLGLALQETLGNLMAGIALLFEKPFTVGDWIAVGDDQGAVVEINWRSVHVRTRERNLLVFPNSVLGRATIVNYARPSMLQTIRLSFGFSLNDPPNVVKTLLNDVATDLEDVLEDPPPQALVREVLSDRIRYEIIMFIDQPTRIPQIVDSFTSRIWYAARRQGLQLPLPVVQEYQLQETEVPKAAEPVDLVAQLRRAHVFNTLPEEVLAELARHSSVQIYGQGERLLHVGEVAQGIILVVDGEAVGLLRMGDQSTELVFGAGELLGVASGTRREANEYVIQARGDVTAIVVSHVAVDAAMQSNPLLASQLAKLIEMRRETIVRAREALARDDEVIPESVDEVLPVRLSKPQTQPDADSE